MSQHASHQELHIRCLQTMLVPLVRFCLKRSIKVHELIESLKVVLIQVATEQIEEDSGKVSVSKLSVITGMHRRDASRIYKSGPEINTEPSIASKVLGLWQSSKTYLNKDNTPKVISVEGENSEFFKLVKTINKHLNPYTVLYELERTAAVVRTDKGLEIKKLEFTPSDDELESAKMLASDTHDLIAAVEENISHEHSIPNLHLVTEYDNIIPEAEVEIRNWLLEAGGEFHKKAREFLSSFDRDTNPSLESSDTSLRVIIGGFSKASNIHQKTGA